MIPWWWIPASFGLVFLLFLASVGLGALLFGFKKSLAERKKPIVINNGPGANPKATLHQVFPEKDGG